MNKNVIAIIYAIAAAAFYALNVPCSKMLLAQISPIFLAGLLYIGAGLGIGMLYLLHFKHEPQSERLGKKDLPYTLGMILLDIIAPILLMFGVKYGTSGNASLLGNSSFILSFENIQDFNFSIGSIFVLGATICWGLENNCTRKISDKSTYQIVTIKGLCSGIGSIIVSVAINETNVVVKYIPFALLLGFIAYGLSIFTYIRAQKYLGAAKTSAFYAIAPFIGVLFSIVLLNEEITRTIFLLYGDEINKTDFHVSIVPIDNEVETQTKDSDKNEPSDENESERMSDPKAHDKKQKEVSEVKKKAAFDEIDNLIGAEEFKALANECVIIAPYLKDSRAEDTFLERKYLISVNEGYGLSCYLKLFGSLTKELGLYNLHPSSPVDEIILPTPDSSKDFNELFAPALSSISSKLKKQIICIDISEWMSKITDKSFRAFLKRIDQDGKNKIVFFRVPFLEPDVLMRIKKDLSDYLFIKSFSIAPFDMEQLKLCAKKFFREKDFDISDEAMKLFERNIIEEKSDGRFYGIKTVRKVVSEMLFQ